MPPSSNHLNSGYEGHSAGRRQYSEASKMSATQFTTLKNGANKYWQLDRQTKKQPHICLCQEPYVYQNKALMQPQTSTKYIGGRGNHPRTAIYTSKTVKAWFIKTISNRDLTAIVVKINNHKTLILSAYLDSKVKVIQPWLKAAMTFAAHRGYATLIGMDSNCHSKLFWTGNQ